MRPSILILLISLFIIFMIFASKRRRYENFATEEEIRKNPERYPDWCLCKCSNGSEACYCHKSWGTCISTPQRAPNAVPVPPPVPQIQAICFKGMRLEGKGCVCDSPTYRQCVIHTLENGISKRDERCVLSGPEYASYGPECKCSRDAVWVPGEGCKIDPLIAENNRVLFYETMYKDDDMEFIAGNFVRVGWKRNDAMNAETARAILNYFDVLASNINDAVYKKRMSHRKPMWFIGSAIANFRIMAHDQGMEGKVSAFVGHTNDPWPPYYGFIYKHVVESNCPQNVLGHEMSHMVHNHIEASRFEEFEALHRDLTTKKKFGSGQNNDNVYENFAEMMNAYIGLNGNLGLTGTYSREDMRTQIPQYYEYFSKLVSNPEMIRAAGCNVSKSCTKLCG